MHSSAAVFASLCETLTYGQLLTAVRYGIAQAEKWGFDMRGPVRLWLENALVFGSDFDTDPQYPWANEIINNTEMIQMHRAESLFEKTIEYRNAVGGERDAFTIEALKRIRSSQQAHCPSRRNILPNISAPP